MFYPWIAPDNVADHTLRMCCILLVIAGPTVQRPCDEPVWRQVLQYHLNDIDPTVAQQAAAALADADAG